jgi:hypothetical protein
MRTLPKRTSNLDPDPVAIATLIVGSLAFLVTTAQGVDAGLSSRTAKRNTTETRRISRALHDMRSAIDGISSFWDLFQQLGNTQLPDTDSEITFGSVQKFLTEEQYLLFLDGFDRMLENVEDLNRSIYQINFSNLFIDGQYRRDLERARDALRKTCNRCLFEKEDYAEVSGNGIPALLRDARKFVDLLRSITVSDT